MKESAPDQGSSAKAKLGASTPVSSVAIREAAPQDIPLVLGLIRELAVYEKLIDQVVATEETLRQTLFPRKGNPPAAHVVIGEVDGRPAGFALYFFNYSTFLAKPGLYLEDIFVMPESRRRGLGKALLLHLAGVARARGCGRMEWSVLDWNEPARKFYRSLGAVPQEEWTVFRLTGATLRDLVD
jgi:GNAT superfamily N-acetyltransferase